LKIRLGQAATGVGPLALGLLAVLIAAGVMAASAMADPATNLKTTVGPYDGNIVGMTDETGVTVNTYDEQGRPIEARDERGEVVSYKYNLEGKPIEITYPNHKSVTRAYDRYGRLKEVTDWDGRTTKFSYDPDGNLTAITFPSETANEDRYTYDGADKTSGATMLRGTEALASLHYARDGDGQLKLATSHGLPGGEAAEYAYGEDNRLTKAGATEYAYDSVGNPTKIGADTYTYNSADELEAGAGTTYAYDEAGQRVEAAPAHGSATTYSYDQAGNLLTVQRPGNSHEPAINDSYTYDGNGLRSSQTIDGTTSNLTWDTAEELPLLLSDGTNSYIYGPDGLPIEQISNTGTALYLHHDQQGSTRLLTNTKGEVEASYTYNPYGKLIATNGTATTPLLYDGQYTNTDTGLIYLRARSYDPTTAQFLSIDPALQVTGEPYIYTGDNPLNYSDPTGKWWRVWNWEFRNQLIAGGVVLGAAGAIVLATVTAPVWVPVVAAGAAITGAGLLITSIAVSIIDMWRG
jgi:RHS repeat-associated protein